MRADVPRRLDGEAFAALEAVLAHSGPDLDSAARAASVLGQIV
jgi:hypothetical protein